MQNNHYIENKHLSKNQYFMSEQGFVPTKYMYHQILIPIQLV